jgi:hypothetical protein
MKPIRKLRLNRETLQRLDERSRSRAIADGDFSCVESCYLVTCGPDCCPSTGVKTE